MASNRPRPSVEFHRGRSRLALHRLDPALVAGPLLATIACAPACAAVEGAPSHALTPVSMFMAADPIVKGIIVSLLLASVLTWTIWIAKTVELAIAKRRVTNGLGVLRQHALLRTASAAFGDGDTPVSKLVREAVNELHLSRSLDNDQSLRERIASRLADREQEAARYARSGTAPLATIGATTPFVGLLGTVWGIMNSFIGIAAAHTTNLAVVAPGIAEALLATAIGLVAAIPAVVIYNRFSRSIATYRALVHQCVTEIERMASREIDHLASPRSVLRQAAE